ncbi:penicillin-binding protein 1C [Hydrocarboniphaga sp.]|uniref:penicillin-binding protein 1C n=1 Tax=Hydrocarboniphaga sp. TaxID=2033016 RepID=UPI00261DCB94|nr:penicillin-binding protein 1C [Hydrocarboniphaga sp.]
MLVTTTALIAAAWLNEVTHIRPPPSPAEVRASYRSSEAQLLDRHGEVVQTLRLDLGGRRLQWTSLDRISPALIDAVISAEDHRFRAHGGVDLPAVVGAIRDRLRGQARRGASTITMQLAAQLDPALSSRRARRSLLQKLRQMRAARMIESSWSKDQILEAYLNLVSFRGESQGVAAAAAALFGKHPDGLTNAEAWTLAALLPAPGAAAAVVAKRSCALADLAGDECDAQQRVALDALSRPAASTPTDELAPHLARRLLRKPGESLISTLDARTQRIALHALRAQLASLSGERVRDGAAVVVDNASGEVLAYVGSAGPASRAAQVDGARALRQAGSTLKPFLYSLAIEHRWLTAASLLDDAPVALEAGPGLYLPQNYEHDFKGLVSVRTALAGSLNIPAVRTLLLTGVDRFRERLHDLGYISGLTESGDYYGYSLALGSAEVSLLEQVNAYRTLANGGRWSALRLQPDAAAPVMRGVVSPQAAWIVEDILADRGARSVTFDLEGPLSTPYRASVKTGTSKNLRDNWCIGSTARYTVGVWVGNFEGDAMRTVSGITGAAPAWRDIFDELERGDAPVTAAPPGLVHQPVRYADSIEPPRDEWFIQGTQAALIAPAARTAERARLVSPAKGSLIALDPDIPLDRQHLSLRAEPAAAGLRLLMDGHAIGSAEQPRLWTPLPGAHRLELLDAAGRSLDSVEFSVRAPR